MSVLTDHDRAIVAAAIARATRPKGVLAETRPEDAPPGGTTPTRADGRGAKASSANRAVSASTFTGACVYCGAPTLRQTTCAGHSDLPALDAAYMPVVTTNTNGGGRSSIPGSAPASSQETS